MDILEIAKTVGDIGLGAIALVMCHRLSKILTNHEVRITALEARRRRAKKGTK